MAGKERHTIYCWDMISERLRIYLASSEKGAVKVGLLLDKGPDCPAFFKGVFPGELLVEDEEMNAGLKKAVEEALSGKTLSDELKLDISHTTFQMKVWKAIQKIPCGETRTYGEVAEMAGCPGGARAIGQTMHRNHLPVIFPCHRVVAAHGIGGFSGGLQLKEYLLNREKTGL